MNKGRGLWYLLTGGMIGLAIGLWIAWGIAPVQYVDTSPATLRSDFKDEYRYLIAASYAATGNLERAQARLALLADANPIKALGAQTQRMLAQNLSRDVSQTLANLSEALQNKNVPATSTLASNTAPVVTPSLEEIATSTTSPDLQTTATDVLTPSGDVSSTPAPMLTDTPLPASPTPVHITPRPTHIPTSTPGAAFELITQSPFCEPDQPGLLQVTLENSSGKPAAGIELVITWLGGEDHFFTGFKLELGSGYADYVMSTGVEYALSLSNGSMRVTGLIPPACTTRDGNAYPGGVRLDFKQP